MISRKTHTKNDIITLVNNDYTLEPRPATVQESQFWQVFDEIANASEGAIDQVGHDELHNRLIVSGFSSEEAVDTYRRALSRLSL